MAIDLKPIFKNWRVIILLAFLILAILAIHPRPFVEGVSVRSIIKNSSAELSGLQNPDSNSGIASRELLLSINNFPVKSLADYQKVISTINPNSTAIIKTDRSTYTLFTKYKTRIIQTNETETVVIEKNVSSIITSSANSTSTNSTSSTTNLNNGINATSNNSNRTVFSMQNVTVTRPKIIVSEKGLEDLGIRISVAEKTNLNKGLDLQGGMRIVLSPEKELSTVDLDSVVENMKQRLNVYGLSDITVRSAVDIPPSLGGTGKQFIIVEIAGASEEEVKSLVARQGKFEAKIGNSTVFQGGKGDIPFVCRSAECSGLDPQSPCGLISNGQYACGFRFSISLSPYAAQRQADVTKTLSVVPSDNRRQSYLSQKIDLFLDDQLVDSLSIGADLKGRPVTDIQISGSGTGASLIDAQKNSLNDLKRLQTILITGSLPVKLEVVKLDTISPTLGEEFLSNALFTGLIAILAVGAVIYARYRRLTVTIPMLLLVASEITLILGFASLLKWNLDLSAIAGIVISIGTGVDHLIIITDESLAKHKELILSLKEKFKRAFSVIFVSYLTTGSAMIPLIFAGAGLVKGFAITTLAGLTIGVFITRPAFGVVIQQLLKEEEEGNV